MPEIKWLKLTTSMFDDEKIKLIESMPEADTLLIIWIKLLCQAGKTNDCGYIYLTKDIPFTEENLAPIFARPLNTIRLALNTFQKLGMITISDNGVIYLPNWEKHQNILAMQTIKEQNRLRQAKHREKIKLLTTGSNVTVTLRNGQITQQNKNKNKNKNKIENNIYPPIIPPQPCHVTEKKENNNGQIFKLFEDNFQLITEHNSTILNDFIATYSPEKVLDALGKAIKQNKRNLAYVEGILKGTGNGKNRATDRSLPETYTDPDEFRAKYAGQGS